MEESADGSGELLVACRGLQIRRNEQCSDDHTASKMSNDVECIYICCIYVVKYVNIQKLYKHICTYTF